MTKKDKLIRMYQQMQRIRKFEEKIYLLFLTGSMPGTMHQCTGLEAVAVGTCENLNKGNYLDAPIKRVGALDTPIPFAPIAENYVIPDQDYNESNKGNLGVS